LIDFVRADLKDQKFTDLTLQTDSVDGRRIFHVHKLVMAAYSPKLMELLKQQV